MLFKNQNPFVLAILIVTFSSNVHGQKILDVNLLTGNAQVAVPVGTVQAGDCSFPIAFVYSGGGVKVEDFGGRYGLGWSLTAEAGIERDVRGFPDDVVYSGGSGYPTIYGWLRGSVGTAVENFTISNDNNASTCSDEVSDYSYMNSNFSDNYDTEPDIFNVNVPGLSFQFAFDKTGAIKTIPYRDCNIDKTVDGTSGQITSFTIITDKGIKYTFSQKYTSYRGIDTVLTPSSVPAFRRNYNFYRHNSTTGPVEFYAKWYLSSIADTRANSINFTYTMANGDVPSVGSENVKIVKYNSSTSSYDKVKLYTDKTTHWIPRVSSISALDGDVVLSVVNFNFIAGDAESVLSFIKFEKTGLRVGCNMLRLSNQPTGTQKLFTRKFLTAISLMSYNCSGLEQVYKFSYNSVDSIGSNSWYFKGTDSLNFHNAQDYWGYYNGVTTNTDLTPPIWVNAYSSTVDKYKITSLGLSNEVVLTGADRSISSSNAAKGSLQRIVYPNGGVTEIEYEAKDYMDKDLTVSAVLGGGVRVKKVTDNDGLNTNEVTNYSYLDPATGLSSGKATGVPDFTFAFPNSTTYPNGTDRVMNGTYRTMYDYSGEYKGIIHSKVTVSKTNGGKLIYEFNTSGVRGGSTVGDWSETTGYIARQITSAPSPCGSIAPDFFTNGKYTYPFAVNPNFDFERGLLTKISTYNSATTPELIKEETFTYQASHSSTTKIAALKFDDVGTVRAYAKYNLLAKQDNLIATRSTKTFNASGATSSVYTQETETFTYPTGSIDYRLPIKIEKVNSDGNTYTTEMRYAKDYSASSSGDDQNQAIYRMNNTSHENTLIETYQSVLPSGGSRRYIGGSLTGFKIFTVNSGSAALPYETYKFTSAGGATSFTPSSAGSGSFTKDGQYYKTGTVSEYNEVGDAVCVTDNLRINRSILYYTPLQVKTAEFSNAKPSEVSYTNFDYPEGHSMSFSGSNLTTGRYSTYGYALNTGATIYGDIAKAATNQNIMFSCWLKDASSSGSLTVSLTASGFSASYTIPFTTGTQWKYYEVKMPKPTASTITVTVSTSANLKIDDVLVYPDNATVKTYSFTKSVGTRGDTRGYQLTAETGMNGTARYYAYTNNTMPYLVKDADENIVQVNKQRTVGQDWEINLLQFTYDNPITWESPVTHGVAVNIYANVLGPTPCEAGISYIWSFGDGSSNVTTTDASVQHTYSTTGKYQVTCTMSASGYTSVSASSPATSSVNALTVN